MTEKQKQVILQLPENGYNIAKTSRKVGYSKGTSIAGTHYEQLREHIEEYYNTDTIKADILKAKQRMWDCNDNASYIRLLELQAKITGLSKENPVNQTNIIGDDHIKALKTRLSPTQPIDNTTHTKPL